MINLFSKAASTFFFFVVASLLLFKVPFVGIIVVLLRSDLGWAYLVDCILLDLLNITLWFVIENGTVSFDCKDPEIEHCHCPYHISANISTLQCSVICHSLFVILYL